MSPHLALRPEKSRTGEGEGFPVLWHHVSGFQWKKRRRRKTMMRQQKTATIPDDIMSYIIT